MHITVNTNVASIGAQRRLGNSSRALNRVYSQLASGRRIAVAADDAAGLAVSERMRVSVRSMGVARRNILDGQSMLQVADGALEEVTEILRRTRELAMQASNGTLSADDRAIIDLERSELASEADRIFSTVEFNGKPLLDAGPAGVPEDVPLQVGPAPEDTMLIEIPDALRVGLALPDLDFTTATGASRALGLLDAAQDLVNSARGTLGSYSNRLDHAIRSLQLTEENTQAAYSRIADVDMATAVAERTKLEILQQAGVSVLGQANVQPQIALSLITSAGG